MSHNEAACVGFDQHDHTVCVVDALASVEAKCEAEGLRLTPVRRKALELLLKEHRALGAYAVLDLLREAGFGAQPPVAYRALDFLTKHGFAHRIERLNAFVACAHLDESHSPAFMICRVCDAVAEAQLALATASLDAAAQTAGFQIERLVVEAEGVCPSCAGQAGS